VRTTLLAIGKLRPAFREACDEYVARLRRFGDFTEREIREPSASLPDAERMAREGERLLAGVPAGATVIALDRTGEAWSSEDLARRLVAWRLAAAPLALLIGGAQGLDPAVGSAARHRWSLGPLTLPHELARVVVVEQWYRAWTILRGEPYHK